MSPPTPDRDPRRRYWLVWIDDTPINVHEPCTAEDAAEDFLAEAFADPHALVEVKMCTRADLDWAGITDGIGADELDELDADEPESDDNTEESEPNP